MKSRAYATTGADKSIEPTWIERREVGPHDVQMEILFSGICHSDLHQARNEWGNSRYPMVPGHEIVGKVTAVGAEVTKIKVGDIGGVGCMVDSCGECRSCKSDIEQFCLKGNAATYNGTEMDRKTPTHGGYASHIVVTDRFVLNVPKNLDPAGAAPLLCAGITTYSPLKEHGCKAGSKVGVVGLGGLGHMAVKIAKAMGAEVTMLSTSPQKEADAQKLGATGFGNTKEPATFKKLAGSFDLIINTISAEHDYNEYLGLLAPKGTMVIVGAPPTPSAVRAFSLIGGNKKLAGSMIGGIKETQEMLEFCAKHGLVSDIELIKADQSNDAYERMPRGDVRYRFVIDGATLQS